MIANFSPLTRRILALGLLLLVLLVTLRLLAGIADGMTTALDRLEDSRFALARVEAVRARPVPPQATPLPPGQLVEAGSHAAAADAVDLRLRGAAGQAGIALESTNPAAEDPANPRLVRVDFAARGAEPALLAFVQAVERDDPPLRLHSWSIARPAPDAPELVLQASAVAAWSQVP